MTVPMQRAQQRAATDPSKPTNEDSADLIWRRTTQVAVILLAAICTVAALSLARPILLPIVSGIVVAMILAPIIDRAQKQGVPSSVTTLALLTVLLTLLYGAVQMFLVPIAGFVARAPDFAGEVRQKLVVLERSLASLEEVATMFRGARPTVAIATEQTQVVTTVFSAVTPAFAQFVMFVFTITLFLIGRKSIRAKTVLSVTGRKNRLTMLRIFSDIEDGLLGYFATVTLINFALGAAVAVALFALGVPSPLLWGFVAFVLNFLPVVGPLIVTVLLLGMGILTMPTLGTAVLPMLVYVGLNTIEGNIVTPRVLGRRLTLEPLAVFLTICAFTWLWGPVGAFLATPLLIIALIVRDHLVPDDEIELP